MKSPTGHALRIESIDVAHALAKWDGQGTQLGHTGKWKASDREFYNLFSKGKVSLRLMRRFAAVNKHEEPTRRTGGYSVQRNFTGGMPAWVELLERFLREDVAAAVEEYRRKGKARAAIRLVNKLAAMEGRSAPGRPPRRLGNTPASKLLFFAAPELPLFMFDAVVSDALGVRNLAVGQYGEWHQRCLPLLEVNRDWASLLPADRREELGDKLEWLGRRCLDTMLYRVGAQK